MSENEKLLKISEKVYAMTFEEMDERIKKISGEIKDLSDIGLKASDDTQMEAMVLMSRIMMDNGVDGSMDGDCCEGCDGHCDC